MLADVFENFLKMCIKVNELDPAHFLTAPGLAWQACLKKTGVKLELLTDNDMLLMVEEGIRGGMCHAIWWAMSQKLPVSGFKWKKSCVQVY